MSAPEPEASLMRSYVLILREEWKNCQQWTAFKKKGWGRGRKRKRSPPTPTCKWTRTSQQGTLSRLSPSKDTAECPKHPELTALPAGGRDSAPARLRTLVLFCPQHLLPLSLPFDSEARDAYKVWGLLLSSLPLFFVPWNQRLHSAREAEWEEGKRRSCLAPVRCLACQGHWHQSPKLHSQKWQQHVTWEPQVQERGKRMEAQHKDLRKRTSKQKEREESAFGNSFSATVCGLGTQYCCSTES